MSITTYERHADRGDPTIDPRAYRRCLAQFATGVAIMTSLIHDKPIGVTANSFSSLSLDPPLVLCSIAATSRSFDGFRNASHFAVNILGVDQVDLSNRFACMVEDKFRDIDWEAGCGGVPLLPSAVASLQCATEVVHPGGDHVLLIGRVTLFAHHEGIPLLYAQGRYAVADMLL